jgi:hypothetical protein
MESFVKDFKRRNSPFGFEFLQAFVPDAASLWNIGGAYHSPTASHQIGPIPSQMARFRTETMKPTTHHRF